MFSISVHVRVLRLGVKCLSAPTLLTIVNEITQCNFLHGPIQLHLREGSLQHECTLEVKAFETL